MTRGPAHLNAAALWGLHGLLKPEGATERAAPGLHGRASQPQAGPGLALLAQNSKGLRMLNDCEDGTGFTSPFLDLEPLERVADDTCIHTHWGPADSEAARGAIRSLPCGCGRGHWPPAVEQ